MTYSLLFLFAQLSNMPKKWTRQERKEHLKGRYRHKREKVFSIILLAVVFIFLLSLLGYGISAQSDPFLIMVLVIIVLVLVPVSVFLLDAIHWEI